LCAQNDRRLGQLLERDGSLPLEDQTAIFQASGVGDILAPIFDFFSARYRSGDLTSGVEVEGGVVYQFRDGTPWLESAFMRDMRDRWRQ
jgi:hypothetical protein